MAESVAHEVVGSGVEIDRLPNPIEQAALRRIERAEAGSQGPLRVAYLAGTDRVHKGFDLLPAILEAADGHDLEWLIVSVEAKQPLAWTRLREVVAGLKGSRVRVQGRSSRVEDLYAATDVVLIPSRQESFCRVAAEAMAAGAAVVSSDLPAIREVCGEVAFYFPVGDTHGAAAHLRCLAASRDLVARAVVEGRRRAERFTPDKVLEQAARLLARARAG